MSIGTHPSPNRLRTHDEQTATLMSSGDRAILMRLSHVRVAVLSVVGGGVLALGVLGGTAQASPLRLAAASPSPGTSTSRSASPSTSASASTRTSASASASANTSANTDTKCQVLPASTTSSPTPTPTPTP